MFVFVYGTLMKNQRLSRALDSSIYLGAATLSDPSAVMIAMSRDTYPALVTVQPHWKMRAFKPMRTPQEQPVGELYIVNDKVLTDLDWIEGAVPSKNGGSVLYSRVLGHVHTTGEMIDAANTIYNADTLAPEDKKLELQSRKELSLVINKRKGTSISVYVYIMRPHEKLHGREVIVNADWRNPAYEYTLGQFIDANEAMDTEEHDEAVQGLIRRPRIRFPVAGNEEPEVRWQMPEPNEMLFEDDDEPPEDDDDEEPRDGDF